MTSRAKYEIRRVDSDYFAEECLIAQLVSNSIVDPELNKRML